MFTQYFDPNFNEPMLQFTDASASLNDLIEILGSMTKMWFMSSKGSLL